MTKPRTILFERSGAWALAMARHLPDGVQLRQTRGLDECFAEVAAAPTSFVALELTWASFSLVLPRMSELGRRFPRAEVIILADRGLDEFEGALREAGAIHFISSPRDLSCLAGMIRRHFGRLPTPPAVSLAAKIWDSLPWGGAAMP